MYGGWQHCKQPGSGCDRLKSHDPRGAFYPVGPFTAYMADPDEDYKEDPGAKEPCDDAYYYRPDCAVPMMGGCPMGNCNSMPCDDIHFPPTAEGMMERRAVMNRRTWCDHMDDFGPVGPFDGENNPSNDTYDRYANWNRYIRRVNNRFYSYDGDNFESIPGSYENAPTEAAMERERHKQMFIRYERFHGK